MVGVTMGAGAATVVRGPDAGVLASGVLETVESLDPHPVSTRPVTIAAPNATLRTTPNRTCGPPRPRTSDATLQGVTARTL
ncbi:uncharacterized protein RMCC_3648 [Mycolicibacterium canariasense]|uniref:Uncharacterized protein n=1 Tax=Mycolicibacterium canariasense TaxID=228230 RepID=A0A100WDQ8_MYCCR|nr:uncharacterized protein RMCC_3648 [Mycolicibacterium canariasense]